MRGELRTAAKRAAGLRSVDVVLSSRQWWAAVLVILVLIGVGCWMVRYTDAEEFWSPVLAWKRRRPRRKPP